jgi:alkaline phosphatase
MSAMTIGVKTRMGIISLTGAAQFGDCASAKGAVAETLAERAETAGMATGVVTTTRLTHATPAAVYAHAPDRNWEADSSLPEAAVAAGCTDIARQLLEFPYGDGIDVALGGGRQQFTPAEKADPERPELKGLRRDGRDLAAEWAAKGAGAVYVADKAAFDAVDPTTTRRLLGLFEPSHMQYEFDRPADAAGEPSLAEMTAKSIEILARNPKGYLLVVEAGRIDHAHHGGNAARALKDTQALSEAVARARAMTSEKDTLIVVTADHGHTLAFAGYPRKGSDILGLATSTLEDANQKDGYALAGDGKPYTTLSYANGPGSVLAGQKKAGERATLTQAEATDPAFRQPALVPSLSETHGGQDVTIYASGPGAWLFSGVVEQNYVYHVINDALRLDRRLRR